jgi:hypothetical protein
VSLINRMLKDIDSRKPAATREPMDERVRQLSMTADAARSVRSGRLWWVSLLTGIAGLAWWILY